MNPKKVVHVGGRDLAEAMIATVMTVFLAVGCGKSSSDSTSSISTTLASNLSSKLNSAMVTAGLSQSQADAVSSAAETAASGSAIRLDGVQASAAVAADPDDINAVGPLMNEGALGALDGPEFVDTTAEQKTEFVEAIVSATTDIVGDEVATLSAGEDALTDDEMSALLSNMSAFAIGALDEAGFPADQIGDLSGVVIRNQIGHLDGFLTEDQILEFSPYMIIGAVDYMDQSGLTSSEEVADALQKFMKGASGAMGDAGITAANQAALLSSFMDASVSHLDGIELTGVAAGDWAIWAGAIPAGMIVGMNEWVASDDQANYMAAINTYATGAVGDFFTGDYAGYMDEAFGNISSQTVAALGSDDLAFTPDQMLFYSELMSSSIIGALDEAGMTDPDLIAEYTLFITGQGVEGLQYTGMDAAYMNDASQAMTNGATNAMGDIEGLTPDQITAMNAGMDWNTYMAPYMEGAYAGAGYTPDQYNTYVADYSSQTYEYDANYVPACPPDMPECAFYDPSAVPPPPADTGTYDTYVPPTDPNYVPPPGI